MSAATRLPAILSTITLLTTGAALTHPSIRSHILPTSIAAQIPPSLPKHLLRTLLALFLALNIKNIPPAWHIRVLRALIHQIYLSPRAVSAPQLFSPLVTHSWNSPLDCDYNLHKSNSTYFADLDIARAHYVGALIRTGLRRLNAGDTEGLKDDGSSSSSSSKKKGGYIIALGGVACSFRKEIAPLARYEIWTRVLSWDEKWIYIVSHFVRPGSVAPKGWHLQPWKHESRSWVGGLLSRSGKKGKGKKLDKEGLRKAVYATSVAKYVCKKGRQTIPPELLLQRSRLLPKGPKPVGVAEQGKERSEPDTPVSGLEGPESAGPALAEILRKTQAEAQEEPAEGELTWEKVEEMRLRGLKFSTAFDSLAGLHDEFGADAAEGEEDVLGVYGELLY
ncbi:hypothetical protein K461DRAFT_275312 [Myriangium duriaei CBS 260.36]|uniref:Capsule polysaccharide biosynthesis protein n=1 Tax=Myriangium duriaei CBS 260.36 TaxID=1168546 RepID=A0A9P4JA15_9PEZI|nr:hypothetical protein K461DRAFT_275312 [Myriangium duriaei CBS 260.36]